MDVEEEGCEKNEGTGNEDTAENYVVEVGIASLAKVRSEELSQRIEDSRNGD